jgi:hypothetical protein
MSQLEHLSPSQLSTLLKCEMQYYFRYIEGIKTPPSGAMIVGTGAHKAQEEVLTARIGELQEPKNAEMVELAVATVEAEFDDREVKLDEGDTRAKIVDNAALAASTTLAEITPKITAPIAVESRRDLLVDDREIALTCILDAEEFGGVRDLKIRKTAPNPMEELQPAPYAFAHFTEYGVWPEFRYDVVSLLKSEVKVREVVCKPSEADVAFFFRLFDKAVERIQHGRENDDWVPAPCGWHCSEKWCGYWNLCRGGAAL